MRFLHPSRDEHLELALEDVFLVPDFYDGNSRLDVDLTPVDFSGGSQPIVSANMNAVTGKRMAETVARYGGLGVLPQDMNLETVQRIVQHITNAHTRFDTALTLTRTATVRDVRDLIRKRAHDMVVVVDERAAPMGVVTFADVEECDQYTPVGQVMSSDMVLIPEETSNEEAYHLMLKSHVRAAPAVDQDGRLIGILSREDAVRYELLRASVDVRGRLLSAAAVGISRDSVERAVALAEMGVGCIVVDTAHGHQRRMIESLARIAKAVANRVPIVAGNVCTSAGTEALIEAGADIIKVNVGPGAMCTTRMQTAVGRPSFTSVLHCARKARELGRFVWADGGVRHPRDVALYLAAGASRVMVGTALAGTYESPGDMKQDPHGRLYKENYGMASARAVSDRTESDVPFERAKKGFFREGIMVLTQSNLSSRRV